MCYKTRKYQKNDVTLYPQTADNKKKLEIEDAFQLFRVSGVPAYSILALLVCFPKAKVAESIGDCCKLCVLWMVGLPFPASHCIHLFLQLYKRTFAGALRRATEEATGCQRDQYRIESWHSWHFQILQFLCREP